MTFAGVAQLVEPTRGESHPEAIPVIIVEVVGSTPAARSLKKSPKRRPIENGVALSSYGAEVTCRVRRLSPATLTAVKAMTPEREAGKHRKHYESYVVVKATVGWRSGEVASSRSLLSLEEEE